MTDLQGCASLRVRRQIVERTIEGLLIAVPSQPHAHISVTSRSGTTAWIDLPLSQLPALIAYLGSLADGEDPKPYELTEVRPVSI